MWCGCVVLQGWAVNRCLNLDNVYILSAQLKTEFHSGISVSATQRRDDDDYVDGDITSVIR